MTHPCSVFEYLSLICTQSYFQQRQHEHVFDWSQTVDIADSEEDVDSTGDERGGGRELTANPSTLSSSQPPSTGAALSSLVVVAMDTGAAETDGLEAVAECVFICRVSLLDCAQAYGQNIQR